MSEQKGPVVAGDHGHFSPQAFVSWTFSKSNNITWSAIIKAFILVILMTAPSYMIFQNLTFKSISK